MNNEISEIFRLLIEMNKKIDEKIDYQWLSITQTTNYIHYSKESIYKMISNGEFIQGIHYHKKNKKLLFSKSELDKWVISDLPANNIAFNIEKTIENIISSAS